jgi:hypothetical protein
VTGAGLVRANALSLPLADRSVHLSISSPPYFALRSYQDDGAHYGGQIGSEARPADFLRALWAVADEVWRTLADDGCAWWNLGDKMAGSGGHNNAGVGGTGRGPSTYSKAADVRVKSLMGLPWRFMMGLINPAMYRAPFEPPAEVECWHDDGPGPCRTCPPPPPRRFPQWVGRAEVVWLKPNGLPESVRDRARRSHEQWFMVTKQPRYFAAIDEIREPQKEMRSGHNGGARDLHTEQLSRKWNPGANGYNPLGKLPGSVWSIPSAPLKVPDHLGVDHFAAFPPEWPRRLIAGWSPSGICTACGEGRRPVTDRTLSKAQETNSAYRTQGQVAGRGGTAEFVRMHQSVTITGYACACPDTSAPTRPAVVLDPFAGTGTVPMMARAMGRFGVGVDLSRDYLRLANWRVFESGHGERALEKAAKGRRPPRPKKIRRPAAPVQAALFAV